MSSLPAAPSGSAPDEILGWQVPPIRVIPPALTSSGQEAVELAASAGLILDPWQRLVLDDGLGEQADGRWAAFEVVLNLPRQNGKGGVIEARELAGLFVFGEDLIIHTAHEFKTAREAFLRMERLIKGAPDLRKRVRRVIRSHGEEGFELYSGQRLLYLARSGGSGRGFSGDLVVMDEAMILGSGPMGALLPTLSARPNPQVLYACSAGLGPVSSQLARLRRRALAAIETGIPDPSLAYFEWSINPHVDECPRDCTEHDNRDDPASFARANPALGIRIRLDSIVRELASMSTDVGDRERLGVGDYPSDEEDSWSVIDEDAWRALADATSSPSDPVAFAIDTTPERSHSAIAVAGSAGANGRATHLEVIDHRPGTGWVVDRMVSLVEKWKPRAVVVDPGGPAGSLIRPLTEAGITIVEPKVRAVAQATGTFIDAVADLTIVHLDQAPLASALAGAELRTLGDASAWARRGVSVDISPLVAVTHAMWGLTAPVEDDAPPNLY